MLDWRDIGMSTFDLIILIILLCVLLSIVGSYVVVGLFCRMLSRRSNNNTELENKGGDVVFNGAMCTYKTTIKKHIIDCLTGLTHYLCLRVGHIPSFKLRNFLYRVVFQMKISKRTISYGGCEFRNPWNIKIGNSVVGPNNVIDGRGGVEIGNSVCTASFANIWTMQHNPQSTSFGTISGKVVVEDYAWISSRATVLPGRTIGKGSVIAAGGMISKDCEPYGIYAGIPAVKKGNRREDLDYKFQSHWWFL